MAEPLVTAAVVGGIASVTVATIGLASNLLTARRRPDPTVREPDSGTDMSKVVTVLAGQLADTEAELIRERRRADACEAREVLRKTEDRGRRGRRT